jgi:hypothetical protein
MEKKFGKSRYTKVYDHVWDDERIKPLSDNAKLLFMFLSTCKHGNALGAYVLPLPYLEGDLGWSKEKLRKPFAELLKSGVVYYDSKTSLIVITGHLKFNPIENENQAKACKGIAETLPKSEGFSAILEGLNKRYHKPLKEALIKGIPEPVTVTVAEEVTVEETEEEVKGIKTKYLDCVLLTDEEHVKLKELFPSSIEDKLSKLNDYVLSVGKKYKSHYHTVLTWARKDGWDGKPEKEIDYSRF